VGDRATWLREVRKERVAMQAERGGPPLLMRVRGMSVYMAMVALSCMCKEVEAELRDATPGTTNHLVCYCRDCRAFLRFVGKSEWLTPGGGVALVHVAAGTVSFKKGFERLEGIRLSDKGLFRYFTSCCKTPFGVTMSEGMPLVAFSTRTVESLAPFCPPSPCYGKSAEPGAPVGIPSLVTPAFGLKMVRLLATWKLTGKGRPHPYFQNGASIPKVRVLTPEERKGLI
jgi:hypothetical protein